MSLTAFNRIRRMKQVEEMKPENIEESKVEVIEVTEEQPKEEVTEVKSTSRRRRN